MFQEDACTIMRCQSERLTEKPRIDITALRKILKHAAPPRKKQHNSFMWKLPEAAEDWSEAKIFGEGLTGISWPFLVRRGGMSIHPHHPATTGMRYTTIDQNQTCSVECGCFCCQMLHTQTKRAIEAATWGWR